MKAIYLVSMVLIMVMFFSSGFAQYTGYYSSSCPTAESIVSSTVQAHFSADPTVAAGLLRMHFHDCFVQGCDGSVLISGPTAERTAGANLGLRGFEVIDDAKAQLEAACPGVVSCADILALTARDAVYLSGGPSWDVPTGRRDGRVSSSSDVNNLPSPLDSIAIQRQKFAAKGLDYQDLVTLVGAHTIGQTDCAFFRYRLYNFTTTGNADPSITNSFVAQLRALCPINGDPSKTVALDIDSQLNFDVNFYINVRDGKGILESDQRLYGDPSTSGIVDKYAGRFSGLMGYRFIWDFKKAMVKMSTIQVKTGTEGEIRRVCSKFN